ncbi:DUF3187 family protein [Ferrimonas senticii]|uniref:DUF3187 family protein n=1 Tax=Ferrimonas senticii TaxID=394566 RepID=UPI00040D5602|nr:DUF3187 family protein [Ferrimonas senticii]
MRMVSKVYGVVMLASSAVALAEPLPVHSQAPLRSLLYSTAPITTDYQLGWQLASDIHAASIFAVDPNYTLDYYQMEYGLEAFYGVSADWRWRAGARWLRSDDAHLDQLTLTFHNLFGLDQNGRDLVPKHRFLVDVPEAGVRVEQFDGQSLVNKFYLGLDHRWWHADKHQLASSITLQYNDGGAPWRSGSRWDAGGQLDYGYRRSNGDQAWLMLGLSHSGADQILGLPVRSLLAQIAAGYRHYLAPRHSIALQYQLSRGAIEGLGQLAQLVHEIHFGYRYQHRRQQWDLILLENAENPDNSADFGFAVRFAYRFNS